MPVINLVDPLSKSLPLWAIGIVLFLISTLALEVGDWFGKRQQARRAEGEVALSSAAKDFIVSSVFRLLALLMGITFAIALDRFDTRGNRVAEEATAISTVYLRADLLDEPHRSRLQSTLRDYARARLVPDRPSSEDLINIKARNDQLRSRLWRETYAAVFPIRETGLASSFVNAMTNALEIGSRRSLVARAPIPWQILDMLILYLVVAIGVLGYLLGMGGGHHRYASNMLIVLFVLAFLLIIDLDRPRSGTIKVPTLALEDLIAEMDADAGKRPVGSD